MLFEISHRTDHCYGQPASEASLEARLTPPSSERQEILSHEITFDPATPVSSYLDTFGNRVTFYAMTRRHDRLTVTNRLTVRTREVPLPQHALDVPVAVARQIFAPQLADLFDFLHPTEAVPTGGSSREWARRYFPGAAPLRESLESLNAAIHKNFLYQPGSTAIATPLETVWKQRAGVCQDFSHVMLSVLRTAGLPARYVCGYIETDPVASENDAIRWVGSAATHAWVEVLLPGRHWVPLDPTNNQWCGTRHVSMACGRDFADAAPLRGTFKGSGAQTLRVKVRMKRIGENP